MSELRGDTVTGNTDLQVPRAEQASRLRKMARLVDLLEVIRFAASEMSADTAIA